jgi:glycine cleavage system aminomethyltransferase T
MGYVKKEFSEQDETIFIKIRNKKAKAIVEQPPFIDK